jgi:hypothetical protein
VISFKGPDHPEEWTQFFDRWLPGHGWEAVGAWRHHGATWSVRCVRRPGSPRDLLDVFLSSDGTGEMTGLVLLTPG